MDCVICIQAFKKYEIILVLGCGHQIHYACGLKLKDKTICCICKKPTEVSAKILWGEEISFFDKEKLNFQNLAMDTSLYTPIINKSSDFIMENHNLEVIKTQNKATHSFVETNINCFYVKILSNINKGKSEAELCCYNNGFRINDIPFFCLAENISREIENKLGPRFFVWGMKKHNKIYLYCRWNFI